MIELPASAVGRALELARRPTLAALMRNKDLPPDIIVLIKIAAGSAEACDMAARRSKLPASAVYDAAVLFLHEVLFAPTSDYYRILGVEPNARAAEIQDHLHWLMKWLHPDAHGRGWETPTATRVLTAWNALKTPERRAAYDRGLEAGVRPVNQASRKGKLIDGSRSTAMPDRRIRSSLRPSTKNPPKAEKGGARGPIDAIRKLARLIKSLFCRSQRHLTGKPRSGGRVRH